MWNELELKYNRLGIYRSFYTYLSKKCLCQERVHNKLSVIVSEKITISSQVMGIVYNMQIQERESKHLTQKKMKM